MLMQDLSLTAATPGQRRARGMATSLLRAASRTLDALAARLTLADARCSTEPMLEFHADAGAPEGALYVDGQLVGYVLGVTRL